MKSLHTTLLVFVLVFIGLGVGVGTLWYQTERLSSSAETLADDVRVSLIDLDGHVAYDTEGSSLPNHADRAEVEAVLKDGTPRTVVRTSATLGRTMLYHARRVGDQIVRIAVPQTAVDNARAHARNGLAAAVVVGALMITILFLFARRSARRAEKLAAERDAQAQVVGELRKLEQFRRDFISNVTHEIKTPLTGILGSVDILGDGTSELSDADRQELLGVLHDHAARLNALAEDILSLATLERAETDKHRDFSPCDIADIARTAVNLQQPVAEKAEVKLSLSQSVGSMSRPCDPRLVEEAITNLISNAIRHSGSSSVEVSLRPADGGRVEIKVTDHGIGIPADTQPHIFERFYRVDKNRSRALGGTGLGLAIVKHIAQLHNGEVTVESKPHEGTTFRLVI